jgi:hypothetical protein
MTTLDERIVARLTELVQAGDLILSTNITHIGLNELLQAAHEKAVRAWGTSVLNLLERVFDRNSIHFEHFQTQYSRYRNRFDTKLLNNAQGVLLAAKVDFEKGSLFDTKQLIQAEVFSDFLEQATSLANAGYNGPAAVLAGAVLEDGLRKLSAKHSITLPPKPKLDSMNAELAKAGAYNVLIQKQITANADIRNKAAHGKWNEFTAGDVQTMIAQVSDFMERNFS